MDGEPRPRGPRSPGARRLRDISHLYLSGRSAAVPVARPPRRSLRLGIAGTGPALARAEVGANLALQFARLQQRTLVVDGDARLPNVGFRLGLEPAAYLAHLALEPARVERALLGLRVVVGGMAADVPAAVVDAMGASDCVLVVLPAGAVEAMAFLRRLAPHLELPPPPTTMARAAAASPMFGAWMATVRRPSETAQPVRADVPLDAVLCVHAEPRSPGDALEVRRLVAEIAPVPVHDFVWGDASIDIETAWARMPAHPFHAAIRQPFSSLCPEHAAARLYESLTQALLAGLGRKGVAHG